MLTLDEASHKLRDLFVEHVAREVIRNGIVMIQAFAAGFAAAPYDLSDKCPSELVFLLRVHETQHQYLSLLSYQGRFIEAVIEVFATTRNPKARRVGKLRDQQLKGAAPLYCNLARDWTTIEQMISAVYPLAKDT